MSKAVSGMILIGAAAGGGYLAATRLKTANVYQRGDGKITIFLFDPNATGDPIRFIPPQSDLVELKRLTREQIRQGLKVLTPSHEQLQKTNMRFYKKTILWV